MWQGLRQPRLAAKLDLPFEQRDIVTALCGDRSTLHSAGPAAYHHDLPLRARQFKPTERGLATAYRVLDA